MSSVPRKPKRLLLMPSVPSVRSEGAPELLTLRRLRSITPNVVTVDCAHAAPPRPQSAAHANKTLFFIFPSPSPVRAG